MAKKKAKQESVLQKTFVPAFIFLVIFYILYQMLTGDRGLVTWFSLREQVTKMTLENNALKENITRLEKKTSKLGKDNPDMDYVDELIRRNLPMGGENETLILVK